MRLPRIILLALLGSCPASILADKPAPSVATPYPSPIFDVREFGAKGDGRTYDTAAISKAVEACAGTGGTVLLSGGAFLSAQFRLLGKMTFHIAKDATLLGGIKPEDYPVLQPKDIGESEDFPKELKALCRSLIYADRADELHLTGEGTINGRGAENPMKGYEGNRPSLIRIFRSHDVLVSDLTLKNPRMWTQVYVDCDRLRLERLKVRTGLFTGNLDGVDLVDCHDATVRDCDIRSQDDGICLKSQTMRGLKNILIEGNLIHSQCNGIKLGTATFGPVENLKIIRNRVGFAGYTGIALESMDGGGVRNVLVKDLVIERADRPMLIILANRTTRRAGLLDGENMKPQKKNAAPGLIKCAKTGPGSMSDIRIENIKITGTSRYRSANSVITGCPGAHIQNLVIEGASVEMPGGVGKFPAKVPEYADQYPHEGGIFGVTPGYAFYVRHADGVHFENIRISRTAPDLRQWLASDYATVVTKNCIDEGLRPPTALPDFLENSPEWRDRLEKLPVTVAPDK